MQTTNHQTDKDAAKNVKRIFNMLLNDYAIDAKSLSSDMEHTRNAVKFDFAQAMRVEFKATEFEAGMWFESLLESAALLQSWTNSKQG